MTFAFYVCSYQASFDSIPHTGASLSLALTLNRLEDCCIRWWWWWLVFVGPAYNWLHKTTTGWHVSRDRSKYFNLMRIILTSEQLKLEKRRKQQCYLTANGLIIVSFLDVMTHLNYYCDCAAAVVAALMCLMLLFSSTRWREQLANTATTKTQLCRD